MRKLLFLVLVSLSFFFFACGPSADTPTKTAASKQTMEPIDGDIVIEDDDKTDKVVEERELESELPMKVMWVHRSLAADLSKEFDSPILLFVYHNEYQPSVNMDLLTFAHPEIGAFINANFIPIRAEYREMGGEIAPCTLMVLTTEGDAMITSIGFLKPEGMMLMLQQSVLLHKMLKKNISNQNEQNSIKDSKTKAYRIGASASGTTI